MKTSNDHQKLAKITDLLENRQEKLFLYTPFFIDTLMRLKEELTLKLK